MTAATDALRAILTTEQDKLTTYNLDQTRRVSAVESGARVLQIQTEHVQSLTEAIAILEQHEDQVPA